MLTSCGYCYGVGACPTCWGRAALDEEQEKVKKLDVRAEAAERKLRDAEGQLARFDTAAQRASSILLYAMVRGGPTITRDEAASAAGLIAMARLSSSPLPEATTAELNTAEELKRLTEQLKKSEKHCETLIVDATRFERENKALQEEKARLGLENNRLHEQWKDQNADLAVLRAHDEYDLNLEPLQKRFADWVRNLFGEASIGNRWERAARLFEEALELAQAEGLTKEEAQHSLNRTYSRPIGNPAQEGGAVLLCLLGWATASQIEVDAEALKEMARIEDPEVIRRVHVKHAEKVAAGTSRVPIVDKRQAGHFAACQRRQEQVDDIHLLDVWTCVADCPRKGEKNTLGVAQTDAFKKF